MVTPHTSARERLVQASTLLWLAADVLASDWELFKTLASASIVMGRSTLHFIRNQDQHREGFNTWWRSLEDRWVTLRFFRDERDALLKERLIATHGLGYADAGIRFVLKAEGEELPPPPESPPPRATRQAFFDAAGWDAKPAVDYIAQYLADLSAVIGEAEAQF